MTRSTHLATLHGLALIGILMASVGCPGTLDDPARFTVEVTSEESGACPDIASLLSGPTCSSTGCHSTASKVQALDLQGANPTSRLVGVCATEGPGALVDPSHPSQSVLYMKLTATPPFGARMPFGAQLDDATIACVLAWVSEQAGPPAICGDGGSPSDGGTPDD